MSSFGDIDPIGVIPGMLIVKHGVPSRNGERRMRVVDGPLEGSRWHPPFDCCQTSGEMITPRCEVNAELKSNMIGTRGEQFVVNVRFAIGQRSVRSGYREMHRVRWNAFEAANCAHNTDTPAVLPLDTGTVKNVDWAVLIDDLPRVCVSLVHGNRAARWVALLGASGRREVMLLGKCCLQCAFSQTCPLEGKWLVLC